MPSNSELAGPSRKPLASATWLLVALVVGLGLRWPHMHESLQLDEYGPLYAVAERHTAQDGLPPASADPLVPVASWEEVHRRSVLPYGITHPYPLYHYLLYLIIQVLPIAEWSLRLPSLIAGLACIAGVYRLCQRWTGNEVAAIAALLTAVEPMQITISTMARPYALAVLLCVLSFLALGSIFAARQTRNVLIATVGYGVLMALIGYLNSLLLLIGGVHVLMTSYLFFTRRFAAQTQQYWTSSLRRLGCFLVGAAIAGVLLLPTMAYVQQMRHEYRNLCFVYFGRPEAAHMLLHNSTILVALIVIWLCRKPLEWLEPRPASLRPAGSQVLAWLGACWLLLPQFGAFALYVLAGQSMYLSRYLCYTTLGGIIVLACAVTVVGVRAVSTLGLVVVVALLLFGYRPESTGFALETKGHFRREAVEGLDRLEAQGLWKEGDLILYRAEFLEGDLLPDEIPSENRAHIERIILAPLTTLYVSETPKPALALSMSHYREEEKRCGVGPCYLLRERFYDELTQKIRDHERLWFMGPPLYRGEFLKCFLPWLADTMGSELKISVIDDGLVRSFDVEPGMSPGTPIAGLHDRPERELSQFILIERSPLAKSQRVQPTDNRRLAGASAAPPAGFSSRSDR